MLPIPASRSGAELALGQALQEDKQEVPEALAGRSASARRKLAKSRENLCNRDWKGEGRMRSTQSLETAGGKDRGSNVRMRAAGWYKSGHRAPGHGSICGKGPGETLRDEEHLPCSLAETKGIRPALQIQARGNGK